MFPWVILLWRATTNIAQHNLISVLNAFNAFCGRVVPEPDIIKRLDLWVDTESGILENLVIFLVGIERWIEADQVDIVVGKALHNIKAIAVIKRVWCKWSVHSPLVDCNMRAKEYPFLWVQ